MRNCPHCQHEFADPTQPVANCPQCGKPFTVADLGGATIEFDATSMAGLAEAAAAPSDDPNRTITSDQLLPGAQTFEFGTPAAPPSPPAVSDDPNRTVTSDQLLPGSQTFEFGAPAAPPLPPASSDDPNRTITSDNFKGAQTVEFELPAAAAPPPPEAPNDDPNRTVTFDSFKGAQTIAFALPGATPGVNPLLVSPAPPPEKKTLTVNENDIGATIQSGRWAPTAGELASELAEAASSSTGSADMTLDSGSISPANLRDMTVMWSGQAPESVGLSSLASGGSSLISGGSSLASGGSSLASGGSSLGTGGSSLASGGGSSPASGPSISRKGRAPSQAGMTGLSAAGAIGESLEQSLIIQPRIVRAETDGAKEITDRIDYNLLKKLGEGGMGVVYAALQSSIRRTVALKMLKEAGAEKQSHREKFLAEAVITGELEHPNIVPIYDLGRDEKGAIFYAMKHVKGTPWDKLVDKKSLHENLEILMKVADGLAFAHSRKVVHRDLKPENVMLGDYGEVLVMDWGLALSLENPPESFSMGGTPAYMAPEMAMGPVNSIGLGSDIYLLGAILYEIVTGLRPHAGPSLTRCLMAAAKNEIVPTEKSGELVAIALKAMATKVSDRYATVRDFQNAIRDYLSHSESIALAQRAQDDLEEACRTEQYETYARSLFGFQEAVSLYAGNTRAQKGVLEASLAYAESALRKGDYDLGLSLLDPNEVQHQGLIQQLQQAQVERESRQGRLRTARRVGIGLVAAIFLIVSGAFFWIRAEAERARAAEVVANNERIEALKQKKTAEDERGRAVVARIDAENQRKVAEEQRNIAEEQRIVAVDARMEEQKQREAAVAAREKEEYEAYVARLGLAAAKIDENAFDHALELLQACPERLRNWEWGRLKYLCTRDVKSYDCEQPLEALAVSPDGKRFAVGGWGGEVRVYLVESGDLVTKFASGGDYVFALSFDPKGTQLAVGSNAKPDYLTLWDAATGQRLRALPGHKDAVLSVVYSRDGGQLLTGSYDNTARLWEVATGASQEFRGHDWWVWSANFSPDEKRIVTGSQDGSAMVWSVATRQPGPPFLGHDGPVHSAVFSPDGKQVASGSYDKRILLWRPEDLKTQNLEKLLSGKTDEKPVTPAIALEGHSAAVRSLHFSKDGRLLLSSSNDNSVCVWDVESHHLLKTLRGHASRVSAAVFAPGGDLVLSGGHDHFVKLWSISKYEELRVLGGRVLKGHRDSVLGAAFSPDGNTVVTASRDRSAIAWDVKSGKLLRTFDEGHAYLASTALFFPGGKHVLTAAVDNTARIWDVAAGTQIAALEGTGPNAAAALSSDGKWIVTGSDDDSLKIWDPTGKLLKQFPGFKSNVTSLAVSADDKQILIGDPVGRVRLITTATGEVVWESRVHSRTVTAVAFLPGGKRVLTASLDNTVAQHELTTGKEDLTREMKHPDAVTTLAISSDGKRALTACTDKVVRLWDIERAQMLKSFKPGDVAATDVAFAPDNRRAAITGADNRVRLWDLETGKEIAVAGREAFLDLSATTLLVWSAAFSATGEQLLTVGGAEAHLWDAASGKQLVAFAPQSAVSSVQFSRNGQRLVTGSWDNGARIWNSTSGAALVKLGGVHTRFVNASVFSPDGNRVLTASDDKTARLWDATNGQLLVSFIGHEGRVTDVAFSAKGDQVLTASDDKTARIWNVETGDVIHILRGHTQGVLCARFSEDGQQILTGSDDTTARLWDAKTGEPLSITLSGHTSSVTSVAFTPDGLRAVTGSKDMTTKVWDPAKGKEILTLTGHTQEITTVAISPDGGSILTGSRDGTAIVWLTAPWKAVLPMPEVQAAK